MEGVLKGIAQVDFQNSVLTGIIFIVALAVNSRISAIFAVVASLIEWLTAWVLGGDPALAAAGIYGFCPVLTGIALSCVFFVLNTYSVIYAIFAIIVKVIVQGAIATLLAPVGIPFLTFPFILTTWLFLFAKPLLGCLIPVSSGEADTPGENLKLSK